MNLLALLLLLTAAPSLHGQAPGWDTLFTRIPVLGSPEEERLRLRQLAGAAMLDGHMLRSTSILLSQRDTLSTEDVGPRLTILGPDVHTVYNSALPFSLNDGPLWAGRGISNRVTMGARLRWRAVDLVLAPQFLFEANEAFQTFSYPDPNRPLARDPLASPFHYPPGSMDLPQRPGTGARSYVDPGQSSLTIAAGAVAFGVATENIWWGPGIRNALLLSAQAPGVRHLFVRTARPLETKLGSIEGRWMVGRLDESDWFDRDRTNDHRSLSALAVVFTPSFDAGLAVGVARAVYAPAEDGALPLHAAWDVFRDVGRPSAAPGDTLVAAGPDQLLTLFARWVFPGSGFEFYGEWGRYEQPASVRDFLELPQHSRGWTAGLQYALPVALGRLGNGGTFRLETEITSLEPSTSYRVRPFGEWYASRRVPQGYTHKGQVLGAAIGPSGSSQWLALDIFANRWRAGVFGGRIRWENQAQYNYLRELRRGDVTLWTGLRADADLGLLRVSAEYSPSVRLNYLFQSWYVEGDAERGVDIRNRTLKLTVSTGTHRP